MLSPKGFEILNATPFNAEKKPEPALGDQLLTQTKEVVSSATKDLATDTVAQSQA
jgi:hypothetical protein